MTGPHSKYILPNDKDWKSNFYGAKSSVLDKNYKKYFFFSVKEELILAGNFFFSFILLWLLRSLITKEA